jgi:hypothetical protein
MRVLVWLLAPALLLACSAPEQRLAAGGSSFKDRFASRIAGCTQRAEKAGRSAEWTAAYCHCPYDVMAETLSPEEKTSLEEATFGAPQDGGARAMQAIERVRPIVRERCGVNIGGPPQ